MKAYKFLSSKVPSPLLVRVFNALYICIFITAVCIPVVGVMARPQDYQGATPTITAPAPYQPTINAAPDYSSDFTCPLAGTSIAGWGSVTPDSAWLLLCGQCVTTPLATNTALPPSPVPTWNGTGTPPPTGTVTPTPTATGTPSATATPDVCTQFSGSAIESSRVDGGFAEIESDDSFCVNHGDYINCSGTLVVRNDAHFNDPTDIRVTVSLPYILNSTVVQYDGEYTLCYTDSGCYPDEPSVIHGLDNVSCSFAPIYVGVSSCLSSSFSTDNDYVIFFNGGGYEDFDHHETFTYDVDIYIEDGCNAAPSVTATPTPSAYGYCQAVSNLDNSAFSWNGIYFVGAPVCFDLGPIDAFAYGWLGTYAPDIPWMAHICLQNVSFGALTIFAVTISLDIILYALGVALLIRNMFIS